MNTFAWNLQLKSWDIDPQAYDFDIVEAWNRTYFVMGEIDISTSKGVVEYLTETLGELARYDISISTEDLIDVFAEWYDDGVYEVVSFEWADVVFENISERFDGVDEVCVVREAGKSEIFWNTIIKVDFLY